MKTSWKSVKLADVVEVASGQVDPTEAPYCDMPHVGGDNIESNSGKLFGLKTARKLNLISGKYSFNEHDVLYSKIRPALNKVVAPDFNGICSADIYPIRPLNGELCREYLVYLLRSKDFFDYAAKHSSRTNIPKINRVALLAYQTCLPSLPEQRRIAALLDRADAVRRKREEGIRLTEELLRCTFLEMFGDPATNLKEWDTEKLGELASIRRGSSPRPIENYMNGNVPWIKIGDATKGDSFYITETEDHVTQAGAEKSVLLEPGALVIANSGVSLGFARILKIKGCVHDGWLSLENLDDRLNKIYLLRLVNCLTDHFRAIAPEGTQPNLNTGIIKEFRVAIPPIALQRKFERAAYAIVEMSAARKKAASEAEALFGSIVQRAFRGEL